jgi:hypothetical protein
MPRTNVSGADGRIPCYAGSGLLQGCGRPRGACRQSSLESAFEAQRKWNDALPRSNTTRMTHHVDSRPPITALLKVHSALMLAASHKRHSRNAHALEFYEVFPK